MLARKASRGHFPLFQLNFSVSLFLQLNKLQEANDTLSLQMDALNKEVAAARNDRGSVSHELEEARSSLSLRDDDLRAYESDLTEIQGRLSKANSELQTYKDQLDEERASKKKLIEEMARGNESSSAAMRAEMDEEVFELRAEHRDALKTLEEHIEKLESKIAQGKRNEDRLEQGNAELEQRLTKAAEKNETSLSALREEHAAAMASVQGDSEKRVEEKSGEMAQALQRLEEEHK